jgi:hypothetical protein
VLAAREAPSSESRQALEGLCSAYWYPLYAFVRRQGHGPEESRDLTQGYFAQLLEKGYLEDFDPSLGRFRVFLKASVKNFLSKERDKAHAWKRADTLTVSDAMRSKAATATSRDRLTPEGSSNGAGRLPSWSGFSGDSGRSSKKPTAGRSSKG